MKKVIIGGLLFSGIVSSVFADAPVVDYSSGAVSDMPRTVATVPTDFSPSVSATKSNFSIDQRINKLEQQVNYINAQNSSRKIEELQQKLQELNGQLEAKTHQLEQLNKQLKDFYQDLNQRVGGSKSALSHNTSPASATAASVSNLATVSGSTTDNAATSVNPSVATDPNLPPIAAVNVTGAFSGSSNPPKTGVEKDNAFLKEQQMYQTAIDLLPDKKQESETKLRDYLKQYPKGGYVANAHYWLGEINYLQKNFDAAEEEFKIVIDKYAKSKRVADAMLKLALVHQNQGKEVAAKQELQKILKRYPGTSAAQLAKQQLAGK